MRDEDPDWDDGLGPGADVATSQIERAGAYAAAAAPAGSAAAGHFAAARDAQPPFAASIEL